MCSSPRRLAKCGIWESRGLKGRQDLKMRWMTNDDTRSFCLLTTYSSQLLSQLYKLSPSILEAVPMGKT